MNHRVIPASYPVKEEDGTKVYQPAYKKRPDEGDKIRETSVKSLGSEHFPTKEEADKVVTELFGALEEDSWLCEDARCEHPKPHWHSAAQ